MSSKLLVQTLLTALIQAEGDSRSMLDQMRPFVETYWESYLSFPYNADTCGQMIESPVDTTVFAYDLATIPIATDTEGGANVVNIAFASSDYSTCLYGGGFCQPEVCGLHLYNMGGIDAQRIAKLKEDIKTLQAKGAIVKLAFGGEEYGNLRSDKVTYSADMLITNMVNAVENLGVDGVDIANEEGCGYANLNCGDQTTLQLYVVDQLRRRMPDKIISYTFPRISSLGRPFRDIVQFAHQWLDTITVYRATQQEMEEIVQELGVPKEKLLLGLSIGCNSRGNDVSVDQARSAAAWVAETGLAGIMTWSLNRDTDHRTQQPQGACSDLQTGQEDGTFIQAVSEVLRHPKVMKASDKK